jgi:hypothetical protein
MSGKIVELLQAPANHHDLDWLKQGLHLPFYLVLGRQHWFTPDNALSLGLIPVVSPFGKQR